MVQIQQQQQLSLRNHSTVVASDAQVLFDLHSFPALSSPLRQITPCVSSPPLETPGRIAADPTRTGWLDLSPRRPPTVRCPRRPFLRALGRAIGTNWSISVETITRRLLFGMSSLEFMRNSRFRSLFFIWFWFFEGLCWEGWGCPVLRACGRWWSGSSGSSWSTLHSPSSLVYLSCHSLMFIKS